MEKYVTLRTPRPFIGPAKDQPEGSNQPGRAHVLFIRLCVQSHSTAADAYVIAPYLSLSVRGHANRSMHQSAHPRCFLISAHPPRGLSMPQNYSEERSPRPIRTSSGMHTGGVSFWTPVRFQTAWLIAAVVKTHVAAMVEMADTNCSH